MTNSTAALNCTGWKKQMRSVLLHRGKKGRLAAVHPTSETSNNLETSCLVYPDALLTRNL